MGPRRTPLALGGAAALLLAALAGYAIWRANPLDAPPAAGSVPAAAGQVGSSPTVDAIGGGVPDARDATLAPSLVDTTPDGALVIDASGAFVPTPDALDFFDYYLSATGEVPYEEIVARIEREIRARVDPPDEALALLASYLDYRDEVRALVETGGIDALPLDRRLQRLREIRRGAFGRSLAEQLFGDEEARIREAIAWRELALDPEIGPEERADRIAALESGLPEEERERRARATVAQRVLEREAELRATGSSPTEVQIWREQEFGAAAAARLADLDRARAEWNARVAHYREERVRLESTSFADEAEAAAALEALRKRLFEGPERIRIRALDEAAARSTQDEQGG